jgi:tryptophan synthase alpha chain
VTATTSGPLTDTRITRTFVQARAEQRGAFMPFVTVGWPELGDTERLVPALIAGGADIIELGVPFSDPIADGPTVQKSSQKALENGVTPALALETVRRLRREQGIEAPLIFMGYYNPILAYGLEAYAADCAAAGVDGLIVPDLPPEESDPLLEVCQHNGLHLIYFLAPTSTEERFEAVLARANGFIYLIARTGVTGARPQLAAGLPEYVARVRRHTQLPLAIGFGISTRAQAAETESMVDGVIVGAALLDALGRASSEELPAEATRFMQMLRGG